MITTENFWIDKRFMKTRLAKKLIVLVILFLPFSVHASLIKISFGGQVNDLYSPQAVSGVNLGDPISGELIYDSEVLDTQPLSKFGYYADSIKELNFTSGSKFFSLREPPPYPTSEIDVINDDKIYDYFYDQILFRAAVLDPNKPGYTFFFQLTFSERTTSPSSLIQNDALLNNFKLSSFTTLNGFISTFPPGSSAGTNFIISSITTAPVPVLPSIYFFITGAALLWSKLQLIKTK